MAQNQRQALLQCRRAAPRILSRISVHEELLVGGRRSLVFLFVFFKTLRKSVLKSLGLGWGRIPVLGEVKEEPLVKLPKKYRSKCAPSSVQRCWN